MGLGIGLGLGDSGSSPTFQKARNGMAQLRCSKKLLTHSRFT